VTELKAFTQRERSINLKATCTSGILASKERYGDR
jgi:hypothetical protein